MHRVAVPLCLATLIASAIVACGSHYDVDPNATDDAGGASGSDATAPGPDGQIIPVDAGIDVHIPDGIDGSMMPSCVDAGATPTGVDLSKLTLRGAAVYNQSNDGWLTLSLSANNSLGAGWITPPFPVFSSFNATFNLRVGPGNTYGEGIAFAVVESATTPGIGAAGNSSYGLNGLGLPGYAVVVDMYKNAPDTTDDDVTTLKVLSLPTETVLAHTGCADMLNDGAAHRVDISVTTTNIHVVLHGITCTADIKSTNNQFQRAAPVYMGFTGATGQVSNSHNEIESASIYACK